MSKLTAADLDLTNEDAEIRCRMPFRTDAKYCQADWNDSRVMAVRTRYAGKPYHLSPAQIERVW